MGDAATFSFYPGKNMGAMGDAGCLITNRDDVAEFSALFARHGGKGEHLMEGINSRLDGLQAAILNVKIDHIRNWTKARQSRSEVYDEALRNIAQITLPPRRDECEHVFHLYVIRTDRRDELKSWLRERSIPTVINYTRPLPLYDAYRHLGHSADDFPVASAHADQILSLPLYPELTDSEIQQVADAVRDFFA